MTSRGARRRRRVAAAAALLAATTVVAGCSNATDPQAAAPDPAPTRAADFVRCPTLTLPEPPPGYQERDRSLQALPDNHMGEVVTFTDGDGQIRVYSGPDLYDTLEDLDMTAEKVRAGKHVFTLSSTLLAPDLLIAVLAEDERLEEPCEDHGVLTRRVSRSTMLDVLESVRLRFPR